MSKIWYLLILIFAFHASAVTLITQIKDIDYPEQISDEVLVFLSSGHVAKVNVNKRIMLDKIHEAIKNDHWFQVRLNTDRYIINIIPIALPSIEAVYTNKNDSYIPSVLKSLEWASQYFQESKYKDKESQCFNRAHIWSYEWWTKHKFYSSKIFLFFTRKFIREHGFGWWFHVAPYLHVAIGNEIKERVMDKKYTSGPTTVGDWIKKFIKENPQCTSVNTYSDYANFPENGNCYVMRASMYYYWPLDLEMEELHGTIRSDWVLDEVNLAYLEAFDIIK